MWKIWKQLNLPTSLGAIAEDNHLTRCAQVCFTASEEDRAEQHDRGAIDEVLEDQDMQEGRDVLDEAHGDADLLEQMPLLVYLEPILLLGHAESEKERQASWSRLHSPCPCCDQATSPKLAACTSTSTWCRCYVLSEFHKIIVNAAKSFQCQGFENTKPRPQTTQSVTTSTP